MNTNKIFSDISNWRDGIFYDNEGFLKIKMQEDHRCLHKLKMGRGLNKWFYQNLKFLSLIIEILNHFITDATRNYKWCPTSRYQRDHSFSPYANFSEKLTFLNLLYAHIRVRIREWEMLICWKMLRTYYMNDPKCKGTFSLRLLQLLFVFVLSVVHTFLVLLLNS